MRVVGELISLAPLSALALQSAEAVAVFKPAFNEESNRPFVVVSEPRFSTGQLQLVAELLQNVLAECLVPHEKYSFRVEIEVVRAGPMRELLDLCVLGLAAALIHAKVPMADTPVALFQEGAAGAVWLCKGAFSDKIFSTWVTGDVSQSELLHCAEQSPAPAVARLKQTMRDAASK